MLGSLGFAHALAGNLDEARRLLEQAVEESRAIRLLYGYAILVVYLGETCLWAGRLDEAVRFGMEALAVARERGERGDEGWALHLTAEIAARREPPDLERAAAAYREALAIAVALEMRPLEARCHLGLGTVLRRGRTVSQAREHARRATDLFAGLGIERWRRAAEALSTEVSG